MGSKHTPGPWSHSKGERHNFFYIDSPSGDVVYVTGSLQPDHVEANARLIAAAPELLAELEMLSNIVEGCGMATMPEVECRLVSARAAIAKATGGAQ
ncbi:TPA: hypothetical protein ACKP0Q_000751 [Stenotrophomonas maltophilia]